MSIHFMTVQLYVGSLYDGSALCRFNFMTVQLYDGSNRHKAGPVIAIVIFGNLSIPDPP